MTRDVPSWTPRPRRGFDVGSTPGHAATRSSSLATRSSYGVLDGGFTDNRQRAAGRCGTGTEPYTAWPESSPRRPSTKTDDDHHDELCGLSMVAIFFERHLNSFNLPRTGNDSCLNWRHHRSCPGLLHGFFKDCGQAALRIFLEKEDHRRIHTTFLGINALYVAPSRSSNSCAGACRCS